MAYLKTIQLLKCPVSAVDISYRSNSHEGGVSKCCGVHQSRDVTCRSPGHLLKSPVVSFLCHQIKTTQMKRVRLHQCNDFHTKFFPHRFVLKIHLYYHINNLEAQIQWTEHQIHME